MKKKEKGWKEEFGLKYLRRTLKAGALSRFDRAQVPESHQLDEVSICECTAMVTVRQMK